MEEEKRKKMRRKRRRRKRKGEGRGREEGNKRFEVVARDCRATRFVVNGSGLDGTVSSSGRYYLATASKRRCLVAVLVVSFSSSFPHVLVKPMNPFPIVRTNTTATSTLHNHLSTTSTTRRRGRRRRRRRRRKRRLDGCDYGILVFSTTSAHAATEHSWQGSTTPATHQHMYAHARTSAGSLSALSFSSAVLLFLTFFSILYLYLPSLPFSMYIQACTFRNET